jgi:hypothetical protein
MLRLKKIPLNFLWAQLFTVVLWYLITVIEWSQNPTSSPGLLVPAIIRGTEAVSVFLVTGMFIWGLEKLQTGIRQARIRLLLLLGLYPGALLANLLSLGLRSLLGYMPPPMGRYFYFHSFHFYLPMLLVIVVYAIVKNQMEINRERENRLKAENLAQQARWMMLRYQINPHFLFNALNTVRALIGEDDQTARRVVTELSEYFRSSLTRDNAALVSLEEEIKAVRSYLEIQQIRFSDKLNYHIEAESSTLPCAIPVFSLQTLVENAIKHGMKTTEGILHIVIRADIHAHELQISVSNTGRIEVPGTREPDRENSGTGLENLKERLKFLDPDSRFSLEEEEGKVVARLFLSLKDIHHEDLEGTDRR